MIPFRVQARYYGFASVVLLLTTGCYVKEPDRACQRGGEAGKAYDITLLEEFVAGITDVKFRADINEGLPTCNGFDELGDGTVLPVHILDERETAGMMQCWINPAEVQLPTAVQVGSVTNREASWRPSILTWYTRTVDVTGCTGTLELQFLNGGMEDVFAERNPNEWPPLLVDRYFRAADAERCPQLGTLSDDASCQDTWVADIQSIQ